VVDRSGAPGAAWAKALTVGSIGTSPNQLTNHKADGINACYVGGHVKWVPSGKIADLIPNVNNPITASAGIVNP